MPRPHILPRAVVSVMKKNRMGSIGEFIIKKQRVGLRLGLNSEDEREV